MDYNNSYKYLCYYQKVYIKGEAVWKICSIAYFPHGYLCRRRHKVTLITESNLKFDSRFLRRKSVCGMEKIMPQNFYELVWIFIIYAFIGWCTEVSYAALDTGKFVNRGFLNGPYCPIYGCGVVIVVAILTPLKENLLILFAGSFLLTSVLEYITGYILEKVFHNKWWDYSDKPFNIKGYVCLKFSIYWGLACTFIMDIIHPIIYAAIRFIPFVLGVVLLSIIMSIFVADCIITVTTILKFNKRLKIMDEMAASIHRLSDEIGENIYENVTDVIEKSEEFQKTHVELMDKISETKENISELPQTAKMKIAETTGAAKDKLAETTGAAKDKFAETTGAAKDKLAETTGAAKDKLAETTGAAKDKLAETTEAAKDKLTETTEAAKNKLAEKAENYAASREEKKRERELALEEKKRERAELMERYEKLYEEKSFGFKRLMKAFPDMKSRDNNETLEKFKIHFNIKKKDENKKDQAS